VDAKSFSAGLQQQQCCGRTSCPPHSDGLPNSPLAPQETLQQQSNWGNDASNTSRIMLVRIIPSRAGVWSHRIRNLWLQPSYVAAQAITTSFSATDWIDFDDYSSDA